MDDKASTLERFRNSRQAVEEAIRSVGDLDLQTQPVEGEWTVKDLAAHLTSWEAVSLPDLRLYASGGLYYPDVINDHDAWNMAQMVLWRYKTAAIILQEMAEVRREVDDLVSSISEDRWQDHIIMPWGLPGTLFDFVDGLRYHDDEHLEAIRRAGEAK